MTQEKASLWEPSSPLHPAQGTEVFTFSEPLGRNPEPVIRGIVHMLAGQEFPPADSSRMVIVRVPNGNTKPVLTYNMFVKPRSDVFSMDELSLLSEKNETSIEQLLDNPSALLYLMRSAAAARRPIAPAA